MPSQHKHSLRCLQISPAGSVLTCSVTGETTSENDSPTKRHHPGQDLWKTVTPNRCPHGLKICLVYGTFIRNRYDSDFVSGTGISSRFIPMDELWIDTAIPAAEHSHVILGECEMASRLKDGKPIEVAYEQARRIEHRKRRASRKPVVTEWKKDTGKLCPHGLKICIVDGEYVRNHLFNGFFQGGNAERYRFVPKDELWIEKAISAAERPLVLKHECEETHKMTTKGWSYDRAHNLAKRIENKIRRQFRPGE